MRRICSTLALAAFVWISSLLTGSTALSAAGENEVLRPGTLPAELIPGEAVFEANEPDPDPAPISANPGLHAPAAPQGELASAFRPVRPAAVPIRLLIGRQNE